MKNLLAAIMSKITTGPSNLYNDVGGRVFLDQAPEGTEFPYIVFFVVSNVPDKTFSEDFEDVTIQFSLFSASLGVNEIATIYDDLKSLFDGCALTITGYTHIWMREENLTTIVEDITTPEGTTTVKHWAVDYNIKISLN